MTTVTVLSIVNWYKEVQPAACGDVPFYCAVTGCRQRPTNYICTGIVPRFVCYDHFRDFTKELAYPGILEKINNQA